MGTKILAIHYSQSGQLTRILRSITSPLRESPDVELFEEVIEPEEPYPFPWPFFRFFDVFPESVMMDPVRMKTFSFDPSTQFDLVILAYQVWFLSPSLPVGGFLKSPFARVMQDTPVVTIIGCRGAWTTAQSKVRKCLEEIGARLIDNAVFVDQGSLAASFITHTRWLWTGKKDSLWGIFPPAGVSDDEITAARGFGKAILTAVQNGPLVSGKLLFEGLGHNEIDSREMAVEAKVHRDFVRWARIFKAVGEQGTWKRQVMVLFFVIFLFFRVLVTFPGRLLVRLVTRTPSIESPPPDLPRGPEDRGKRSPERV